VGGDAGNGGTSTDNGGAGQGGAIYTFGTTLNVASSSFTRDRAQGGAGGQDSVGQDDDSGDGFVGHRPLGDAGGQGSGGSWIINGQGGEGDGGAIFSHAGTTIAVSGSTLHQ
jgi:hypothetical protein